MAKINRCVRVRGYTQCNLILIPLSQWRCCCWKLIIHVRVEHIIAGKSTREQIYSSATCMCVQHNMRWWVFVIHKMHNNNKWEQNISLIFFLPCSTVNFNTVEIYTISFQFLWVFILKYFFFCCCSSGLIPLEGNNHIQYLHLWIILKDMHMHCTSPKYQNKKNASKQDIVSVARAQSFIGVNCMP